MTLRNNRAPLLCYFKLCAPFHRHQWIQVGVTVQKRPNRVKIGDFLVLCDLEIWRITLKNNRAPLLCHIKLFVSFHRHMWIQTGATVRKRLNWALTCMALTFGLWSFFMDITFVNNNHSWWFNERNIVKKVWQMDWPTDIQKDGLNHSKSCLVTVNKLGKKGNMDSSRLFSPKHLKSTQPPNKL